MDLAPKRYSRWLGAPVTRKRTSRMPKDPAEAGTTLINIQPAQRFHGAREFLGRSGIQRDRYSGYVLEQLPSGRVLQYGHVAAEKCGAVLSAVAWLRMPVRQELRRVFHDP